MMAHRQQQITIRRCARRSVGEGATLTDNVLVYKTALKLPPLLAVLEAARPNH
jgi:hypothetical protein